MTFLSCYWPLFSKRPRALKASIRTCAEEKRSRRRCNIFSRRSPGSRRVTSHVNATLFRLNASGSSCHFSWLDHFYNEIWNGVWLCEANLLLAKWLSKSLKVRLFLMQSGSIREICQLPLSHSSYTELIQTEKQKVRSKRLCLWKTKKIFLHVGVFVWVYVKDKSWFSIYNPKTLPLKTQSFKGKSSVSRAESGSTRSILYSPGSDAKFCYDFLSCFLKLLSHLNTIHTHCFSCERFGSLQC